MLSGHAQAVGITMTGPRPGGFGALNDRTNEICAQGDLICAAPERRSTSPTCRRRSRCSPAAPGQPVHALYNTTQFWSLDGQPATVWTRTGRRGVIDAAPHPKHG